MPTRTNQIIEIKNFRGGSNLLVAEARLALDESKKALNLIQVEDGLWKPRWGSAYYGATLGASCDGAKEFVKSNGTTELIAIAGGVVYKSTDGGAWTSISGATFTAGTQCYFMQIAGFLYIANGTDSLARYNGTVLTTYTALSAPANPTASRVASGLSSGTYTYYAEITALNDIGETTPVSEVSLNVNKHRDSWVAATDKGIHYSWSAVASATAYQVYVSDTSGREKLLTSTPNTFFIDDGSIEINTYVETPEDNTTSAPKFKSMGISGNRIWSTNDPDNLYKVYWSGTGTDIGKFSDFYGGGWVNLEKGGREMPTVVTHYQSGQGAGIATVFCKTPEGRGSIWQITIDTITVGTTSFAVPTTGKIVGSFGTDSINGVVATNNDILFPNKRGVYSLGPEKNYYGILRTNELTAKIRPYWRSLTGGSMSGVAGYFYDSKVFFSVPTGAAGNARTIIYDLERLNWTVEWTIGAKSFFEYTDTGGTTHFMHIPVGGSQLVEMSENIQGDLGVGFSTNYTSGRIPLSKYWKDFMRVQKVFLKLGSPRGSISFEVSGTQKNKPFSSLGAANITATTANTGLGWDSLGSVKMGDTAGTPETFSDSSDPYYIKVRKKLRDIQYKVTSNSYDADYVLQGIIAEGRSIKVNPPSAWKI